MSKLKQFTLSKDPAWILDYVISETEKSFREYIETIDRRYIRRDEGITESTKAIGFYTNNNKDLASKIIHYYASNKVGTFTTSHEFGDYAQLTLTYADIIPDYSDNHYILGCSSLRDTYRGYFLDALARNFNITTTFKYPEDD